MSIPIWLEVMSPWLERVSSLPLPVALLPPLWPRETTLSHPVGLIVLIAVRVRLCRRENSVWENFFQLRGEERLEAAASLGHLRVRLSPEGEREITLRTLHGFSVIIKLNTHNDIHFLTYIIELCTVAEHEIDISNKLVWWVIMSGIPLVEFGPDHRQVHRPLNDLVVMTSLHEKPATILD